jgi:hypothetical protein
LQSSEDGEGEESDDDDSDNDAGEEVESTAGATSDDDFLPLSELKKAAKRCAF